MVAAQIRIASAAAAAVQPHGFEDSMRQETHSEGEEAAMRSHEGGRHHGERRNARGHGGGGGHAGVLDKAAAQTVTPSALVEEAVVGKAEGTAAANVAPERQPGAPKVELPVAGQERIEPFTRYGCLVMAAFAFYMFGLRWDFKERGSAMQQEEKAKSAAAPDMDTEKEEEPPEKKQIENAAPVKEVSQIETATPLLPSIWPKFIKLHSATQLFVPASRLNQELWSLHAFGVAGTPMLTVTVRKGFAGDRILELITTGLGGHVIASVCSSSFKLNGMGRMSVGRFEMPDSDTGRMMLVGTCGQSLLVVSQDVEDSRMEVAAVADGRRYSTVVRKEPTEVAPYDHYELTTQPGIDVVLMLACSLTRLVFAKEL